MATWWLTGTMTEEEMRHEHPLEYERIKKTDDPPAGPKAPEGGQE
ncbi:MAG: hypothetical protein M5R36_07635 [Deltaproteobacteria bacterium]|nr:hypothetical protein [Deltaproteobacteria bacterium]